MTEQNNKEKESCCHTSSGCCSGKKVVLGLVIGFLLFTTGYLVGKTCTFSKFCPMTQGQMQMQK